ncbi:ankyrin repeat domain-containing protein [Foetidibacter luteolus]|uniref:ankyrin repeat domain-containing protein n=1 Tax=Foetidibacter luteolus TaxID=2608880 RepID=UPI00129C074F|nr:ankyrin repeat domain-containing protein [Foetidibacter luteolus]
MDIRNLINNKDYQGIEQALASNASLANEGIAYDEVNTTKAHPLHRICDGVFANTYTDEEAVAMATIFLQHGADVNGGELTEKKDSPLVAAASLHADKVAFLYIEHGADINHRGCHGGTALHWAAWCGRDKLVERLLQEKPDINKLCIDFKATPIFWAVHGLKNACTGNPQSYYACIKSLLEAGADKHIPNVEGASVFDMLGDEDEAVKKLLTQE